MPMAIDPVNLEETDVTTELYKAVIGPKNQDYYLSRFAKFDAAGKTSASWHWPAFFSTLNWLIYRKMWGVALWFASLSITVALAVFGIGKLTLNYASSTEAVLILLFLLGTFVLPGLYANAAYYRFCEKKITKALTSDAGVQGACELLARQASTNRRWLILALLNLLILALVAGAARLAPEFNLARKNNADSSSASKSATIGAAADATPPPAPPRAMEPAMPAGNAAAAKECLDCPDAPAVPAERISTPGSEAEGTGQPGPADAPGRPVASAVKSSTVTTSKMEPLGGAKKPERGAAAVIPVAPAPAAAGKVEAVSADDQAKQKEKANQPDVRYFLQVGAFAQESNARNTLTKLEAIGLPAFTQPVEAKEGRLMRIRVGPFNNRAEASKAAVKIRELALPVVFLKL
jgi:cell division septation protein DedD